MLAEVNRRLDTRGLIVKGGTLVDAAIIAAAASDSLKRLKALDAQGRSNVGGNWPPPFPI